MNPHRARHGSWHALLLLALCSLPIPESRAQEQPLPSVFLDIMPVKKVRPEYPAAAQAQHIAGRVRVRLTIAVNGRVSEVKILAADPPGVFDASAMEAAFQYVFRRNGSSYQADQEIIFKLE